MTTETGSKKGKKKDKKKERERKRESGRVEQQENQWVRERTTSSSRNKEEGWSSFTELTERARERENRSSLSLPSQTQVISICVTTAYIIIIIGREVRKVLKLENTSPSSSCVSFQRIDLFCLFHFSYAFTSLLGDVILLPSSCFYCCCFTLFLSACLIHVFLDFLFCLFLLSSPSSPKLNWDSHRGHQEWGRKCKGYKDNIPFFEFCSWMFFSNKKLCERLLFTLEDLLKSCLPHSFLRCFSRWFSRSFPPLLFLIKSDPGEKMKILLSCQSFRRGLTMYREEEENERI